MHSLSMVQTNSCVEWVKVSIIFEKESFLNAKKVLNFMQSLTNEKRVINSEKAFHKNLWSKILIRV